MYRRSERLNPIMVVLLAIPLLMIFGVEKGCETVKIVVDENVGPPAVVTKPVERIKEGGWRI